MSNLVFYKIELIPIGIHLFIIIWTHAFPAKKIQNPSKSLLAGCCYYSELAATNQELWDMGQSLYKKWNKVTFLPSALISMVLLSVCIKIFRPEPFDLRALIMMICCILVPVFFMSQVRKKTEKELKEYYHLKQREMEK